MEADNLNFYFERVVALHRMLGRTDFDGIMADLGPHYERHDEEVFEALETLVTHGRLVKVRRAERWQGTEVATVFYEPALPSDT